MSELPEFLIAIYICLIAPGIAFIGILIHTNKYTKERADNHGRDPYADKAYTAKDLLKKLRREDPDLFSQMLDADPELRKLNKEIKAANKRKSSQTDPFVEVPMRVRYDVARTVCLQKDRARLIGQAMLNRDNKEFYESLMSQANDLLETYNKNVKTFGYSKEYLEKLEKYGYDNCNREPYSRVLAKRVFW